VSSAISTGGYFHWRCARLFPLEVISTGGVLGYFHWRLFPLEVIISTGGAPIEKVVQKRNTVADLPRFRALSFFFALVHFFAFILSQIVTI
jgi:hypothetical protein